MEEKSLVNLEFDKVLALIAGFAGSNAAKDEVSSLRPFSDIDSIHCHLSDLDEAVLFLDYGRHLPIGGIREFRDLLEILDRGEEVLSGEDFLKVRSNIEVVFALRKAFADVKTCPRLSEKLMRLPDLSSEYQAILSTISEKGEVRDDASPKLTGIRRDLTKAHQEIEKRLSEFLNSGSEIFQDRFFTIRNDRYVVPIKASFQNQIQGIVHDQSGSGQTVFIEPLEFLGLTNRLSRLKAEEREEIKRILVELSALLSARGDDLGEVFSGLIFFDVLNAKARFSRKYNAHRPGVSETGSLSMIQARHPLLHPECVPMDIAMDKQTSCIIITGANGGGKTVSLKTVGVNCLLMQSGCYVLASPDSKLPVFSEILADIGEAQSIEDHLSTFTSHIKRINEILSRVNGRSLVLLDEIGVGTDPVEGSALAIGVLRVLVKRGAFSIATSHYDALKQAAFTIPGFVNAAMEFDYNNFRPTFRFILGIPGRSNALFVARMFGIPEEILQEMSALLKGGGGDEARLIEALEQERSKAEALRKSWEEKERVVSQTKAELDAGMAKLVAFRQSKRDELIEEFEGKLKKKIKDLEHLIGDLKRQQSAGKDNPDDLAIARLALGEAGKLASELDSFGSEILNLRNEPSDGEILPGDQVVWQGSSTKGVVSSIDEDQSRAVVDFEGKQLIVSVSELEKTGTTATRKKPENSGMFTAPSSFIPAEVDLRGMRVEEALEKAENYLKLASASHHGKVILIHGKGTGALQKAIHEFLKKSKWKSKFRSGRYGEGDLGVTVVIFDPASDDRLTKEPKFEPRPKASEAPRTQRPQRKKLRQT